MNDLTALDPIVLDALQTDERTVYLHTHPPAEWIERVGPARVRTCPISESAMVGLGVGAAMRGLRPIVDVNRASFILCAMDQICNHAAKMHYLSAGQYSVPITITCALRGDYHVDVAREHAPYAMFANVPGLTVVLAGNLPDAKSLLRASLQHDGPVLYFTSPLLVHDDTAEWVEPAVLGRARVVRRGFDVTVVAIGAAMLAAAEAAKRLADEGVRVELIDLLTLSPLDVTTLAASVRTTGRLVVVEEASGEVGLTSAVVGRLIADPETFHALRTAPGVINGISVPMAADVTQELAALPTAADVVAAVRLQLSQVSG